MKARIDVIGNAYGFGYDWILVLPAHDGLEERTFWLGQDAKVCYRLLGASPKDVAEYLKRKAGTSYIGESEEANETLANLIIEAFGGEEVLRDMDDWDAHMGGG